MNARVANRVIGKGASQVIQRESGPLSGRWAAWFWGAAAMVVGIITFFPKLVPVLGAPVQWAASGVTHIFDRFKNGADKDYELKVRAKFYRNQIAATLGISPEQVGISEFQQAANINPQLRAAYEDVRRTEDRENRNSLAINTVAAAVYGGEVVKIGAEAARISGKVGLKMAAGSMGGMGVSMLFNKDIVSAHEVMEAVANDMQQGKMPTAREIFMLRAAQDPQLTEEIKKAHNGKGFHKLGEAEQMAVMSQYPALTNAVTSEAHAVAQGMLPVQDLMAREPNLNAAASRYATGTQGATSFLQREQQRRAAASTAPQVNGVA